MHWSNSTRSFLHSVQNYNQLLRTRNNISRTQTKSHFGKLKYVTSRVLSTSQSSSDVSIIGGGIVGNMIAYHLITEFLLTNFTQAKAPKITIIERDPTYRYSSTCLSVGGIRQQFGLKENISMSLYGIDFLKRLNDQSYLNHSVAYNHAEMTNEDIDININYRGNGYLVLASNEEGLQNLKTNKIIDTRELLLFS